VKLKYIIGILALLIFTVSNASAFSITTVNEPGDVPADATIIVEVTYGDEQITYVDTSTGITDSWFKALAYNLTIEPSQIDMYVNGVLYNYPTGTTYHDYWAVGTNDNVDGFGPFTEVSYLKESMGVRPDKVVIHLPGFTSETIPGNDYSGKVKLNTDDPNDGNQVAVHLSWVSPTTPQTSIKVTGGAGGTVPIPEFPSIALPVAAILGITFIIGSRKKE